ncbi:efflux RND transporter periplasmic adaptor subunit [Xylella taiwanensis]|uniref:Hemolysin D n=2 Tax=Xylella taiwanensis TaxID=1444770 RepID=Z9JKN0_9GAMM|nr:efflux RND transporter periplasmic adaptor subunit [Xylella taiwanensis]EWS78317.1 hemolysin D [Xylella taiwanensis]MCD8455667.1 efflux RND transporter periplasmic adaptor subunit [Xylella taiwanensis]MCD8464712.1 efflux RND transporter periplasmic adaptor subunit [Xylella taiwanensis]MCD8467729.1 efflux RND transporter periplasmic adaptor subunit [Xylella taiwanensis]MCD8469937.1 efflux RND transporter periplasmic adaptor subunit [Xylella taiwanensis]
MKNKILTLTMSITLGVMTLSSCDGDPKPKTALLRTVKLETVGTENLAKTQFVASIRQEQRADLAFENGGRIAAINVDVGDRVRHEQVLARLDPEPVRLRLQQAEATLRAATAQLHERQTQLNQQQALFKEAMISQATLTSAQVALDTAQADLHVAESNHALARRAVHQSELRAPFDGSVVARLLQPQADTGAGQTVLQMEGQGRLQAVATLPANIAQGLNPDRVFQGNRTDTPQASISLRLRSVSPRLENGASVQAIFDVTETTTPLRSGDTLLLALSAAAAPALSVPLPAMVPGVNHSSAIVFVYHPKAGVVLRRDVVLGTIEGERVQIRSGLKPGEQVVVAGAAFLSDGQKVLPFRSNSRLSTGDRL